MLIWIIVADRRLNNVMSCCPKTAIHSRARGFKCKTLGDWKERQAAGRSPWPGVVAAGFLFFIMSLVPGCGHTPAPALGPGPIEDRPAPSVRVIGYAIQAGAFAKERNAHRLTRKLRSRGLDAYYFPGKGGLYRVRFGDFSTRKAAARKARELRSAGIIRDYHITRSRTAAEIASGRGRPESIRKAIVETAKGFLGVPYRWGSADRRSGFDCSGFTMTVYRLNGLKLPRSSRSQWKAGKPIPRDRLKKGDLVFFDISRRGVISHVGIYTGGGKFIHAPSRGKRIRVDSLSNGYFRSRYAGARKYL
ncbi:MAG: C40 family peptidase [Deltaproteobacteria bacterium]|nr:C40 family peptidase [Deltaproteobacteria bacterium]